MQGLKWESPENVGTAFGQKKKKIDNILDGLTQEKCYTPSRMCGWIGTR